MKTEAVEKEVSEFIEFWLEKDIMTTLTQMKQIVNLYEFNEGSDWVGDVVKVDEKDGIRLISACYLLSRFCEFNVGTMLTANIKFKRIWEKMEKVGLTQE